MPIPPVLAERSITLFGGPRDGERTTVSFTLGVLLVDPPSSGMYLPSELRPGVWDWCPSAG